MKNLTKLLSILLFVCVFTLSAKADDFSDAMIKAKKDLSSAIDKGDLKAMTKARGEFERILQLKKDTWLVNYYLAYADYSIGIQSMQSKNMDDVKKYTQSGLDLVDKSILERDDFADAYVLQLALNFNRWNYESDKVNEIMAASQQSKSTAEKLDPNNPRLHLLNGVASFYTPEAFGGGTKPALEEFEKSISLFSSFKSSNELYPDWGNDIAYGYMALAYLKQNDEGDKAKAKASIDKALEINPQSGFILGYVQKEYDKEK